MFFRMFSYVWRRKGLFLLATFFILINSIATLAPAEWGGMVTRELQGQSRSQEKFWPLFWEGRLLDSRLGSLITSTKNEDTGQNLLQKELGKGNSGRLILLGLLALIIFTTKLAADYARRYTMTYLGTLIATDMQGEFHSKVLRLPVPYFRKRKIGELISRTTNDINLLRNFLGGNLISIINDPLILIIGIVRLFMLNWIFTLELFAVGILIAILVQAVGNRLRKVVRRVQASLGDITANIQESLFSVEIIKLFHRERFHDDRFTGSLDTYLDHSRKSIKINSALRPMVDYMGFIGGLIVIATGVVMIINRTLQVDELVTFLFYIGILSAPLNAITNISVQYKAATAAGERFFEVLDEQEEPYNPQGRVLPPLAGEVEFRNVSFAYKRGEPVLRSVSLKAKPGQVIAIVGSSGGGKTTLVNLIPRLIDPQRGTILMDGHNTRRVTLESLRSQIGMVTQDNILFPGTVRENILYGKLDAGEDEIIEAARAANAHEFIEGFPRGYDTEIGERGLLISGGQRQRLALARVMLKRPRIMILDEATSALDSESEQLVQKALSEIVHMQTTFVIAHRLSTIMEADQILVLDQGRIVERGTHNQLMARKKSIYQKLYSIQFADRSE